jgi:hypothetical protein
MKITPNSGFPVYVIGDGPLLSVDVPIEPELLEKYVRVTEEYQTMQDLLRAKYFVALESMGVIT